MQTSLGGEVASVQRVLVVDDEQAMIDLVTERLTRDLDGVSVSGTTDPAEAIESIERGDRSCLVSDYDMPGMDGLTLLRRVREIDDRVPFVLFTGRGSEEIASDAISAGVTDYVQKGGSESFTVLANSIDRALSRRRVEREREAARRSLAAKDATLESLFESIPAPTLVVDAGDPTMPVDQVNPAFTRRFDAAPERTIGTPVATLVDTVGERSIEGIVDGESGRQTELTCRTAAGEREFLATVVPAGGDGDEQYVVLTDINEQKRVQRALADLHEATQRFLAADDPREIERIALSAAADVLGFPYNGARRYDAETDRLVPSETTSKAADRYDRSRAAYERDDTEATHAWRAFDEGEPVTVGAQSDIQREGVASKVYLPVGEWGVLTLSDPNRDRITETEEYLGKVLGSNTAAALASVNETAD
ncbi:response regulator [Halobaculum sp. CBA1158]|uniref:response regulator n=1 Tax=Halobaculum sp. CBA1158 TaxID=2904243 RepID=UPI001F2E287D|nr:response regulator [Halobaculum sp. CBA1158]UIP01137.1 response regulator [Halobaculum sp. CBA1158]